MLFFAVMIIVSFLVSACAIKVDIAHKDSPNAYRPAAVEKMPLKAVIVLCDENEIKTKQRFPGAGISETYNLPSGNVRQSPSISPNLDTLKGRFLLRK